MIGPESPLIQFDAKLKLVLRLGSSYAFSRASDNLLCFEPEISLLHCNFSPFLPSLLFVFRHSIELRALELMSRIVAQYMKLSTDGLKHSHSVNSRYEIFSSI